jgi:hypothetical protein
MSDEQKNAGDSGTATAAVTLPDEQPSPDEHTTEPNAPENPPAREQTADGKWTMPKPKFQQTSGYLPQGYLKDIKDAPATRPSAGSEDTTQEQAPFTPALQQQGADGSRPEDPPAIEPQPDLLDQLIPEEPVLGPPPATAAKSGPGVITVFLGIAGILIFIAVFIAAVYFLFLSGRTNGATF